MSDAAFALALSLRLCSVDPDGQRFTGLFKVPNVEMGAHREAGVYGLSMNLVLHARAIFGKLNLVSMNFSTGHHCNWVRLRFWGWKVAGHSELYRHSEAPPAHAAWFSAVPSMFGVFERRQVALQNSLYGKVPQNRDALDENLSSAPSSGVWHQRQKASDLFGVFGKRRDETFGLGALFEFYKTCRAACRILCNPRSPASRFEKNCNGKEVARQESGILSGTNWGGRNGH